uniref:Immunoglobulin V-set domain-containing protein n=1 Tax=Oncorhynchus kisutch TaxID=8019 RepID=A0A8C7JBE6_ONCKI
YIWNKIPGLKFISQVISCDCIVCFCLTALCVVGSAVTKEVVGGQITVGCSFTLAGNNNKYFCKGTCSGRDILVETNGSKNVSQDRYSIEDKGDGDFYVTIKNLMKTDSGTYWCGVGRYDLSTTSPNTSSTLPNLSTTSPNTSSTLPNHVSGRLSRDGMMNLSSSTLQLICCDMKCCNAG